MDDFLERFIEKQINDGKITEEELSQRIEEVRGRLPIPSLREEVYLLAHEIIIKEERIEELENQYHDVLYLLMTGVSE